MNEDYRAVYAQRSLERDNAIVELRKAIAMFAAWSPLNAEQVTQCSQYVRDALAWLEGNNPKVAKLLEAANGESPSSEAAPSNWATSRRRPLSESPELWPEPTMEEPDLETLEEWFMDSVCEATDGCPIEHDGCCPHGYPSWFLYLGLI